MQGFTSVAAKEPLHVLAEIWLPNHSGRLARLTEGVHLNARPPIWSEVTRYSLLLIGMILLGIFPWAFTGKTTTEAEHPPPARDGGASRGEVTLSVRIGQAAF